MASVEDLIEFLRVATTSEWQTNIKKLHLANGETIACIKWDEDGQFYISGTDIIRSVTFRFEQMLGRVVRNIKKFEEGVFSDLRNLKPGLDASLQEPHSSLLRFMHRNQCIRTQKKQKVFYFDSVPHHRIFAEAIEREIKRDALGLECTTIINSSSASSSSSSTISNFNNTAHLSSQSWPPINNNHTNNFMQQSFDSCTIPWLDTSNCHSTVFFSEPVSAWVEPGPNSSPNGDNLGFFNNNNSSIYSEPVVDPLLLPNMEHSFLFPFNSQTYPPPMDFDQQPWINKMHHCTFPGCTKKFKRKEHVRRHLLSHTGHRPYHCPIPDCNRPFSRKDNLAQHIKTHRF